MRPYQYKLPKTKSKQSNSAVVVNTLFLSRKVGLVLRGVVSSVLCLLACASVYFMSVLCVGTWPRQRKTYQQALTHRRKYSPRASGSPCWRDRRCIARRGGHGKNNGLPRRRSPMTPYRTCSGGPIACRRSRWLAWLQVSKKTTSVS
jgi:hypothetical protein